MSFISLKKLQYPDTLGTHKILGGIHADEKTFLDRRGRNTFDLFFKYRTSIFMMLPILARCKICLILLTLIRFH